MNANINYLEYQPNPLKRLTPLFLIIFIDSFGYFLIIPVLLRLFIHGQYDILPTTTSMATRDLVYSVTLSLSPLAFLLASPIVGNFSDRFGRKITMFYCLLGGFIGYLLPIIGIYTHSLALFLIGRFIAGASTSSQPVAQAAVTDFTTGRKKAFYLSLIGFAMTLAMALGPILGSYLSDKKLSSWFTVVTPFWFAIILSLINIILLLLFFKNDGQVRIKKEYKRFNERFRILITLLSKNNIALLMSVFFFLEIAWSQYYQAIFLFLSHQYQYSPDKIGLFTGYIGVWMSLGLTVVYKLLIKYVHVRKILFYSLIITTIGLIGCNYIVTPLAQWIFIIPVSICVGTAYPSVLALMSNRSSAEHQGWVLGIASTALGLAWMITGFLSGWLIGLFLQLPLIVAAIAILLALILSVYWMSRERLISMQSMENI